ncbi:MAG: hypothetical protein CVT88_00595 [Candidatus Altiarchaeales archaeon HGW-Altiarchaeales-1]|nr:MAG: hypothetical protein CVT88_00595 [Candidatus Altiarchaeales archaeon HGW-Altiarchaeales-1]
MKINIKDIDGDLNSFITLLRNNDLNNIVIVGGAVRDIILNRPYKDIDIAIRLNIPSPSLIDLCSPINKYEILPIIQKELFKLDNILNCKIDDFIEKGSVPFGNTTIDILGLVVVKDKREQLFPDIFIDNNNQIFGAYSELTINRLALDFEGNIWPTDYIEHIYNNIGYLTNGVLGIDFYRILRIFKTCELLNTKLDYNVSIQITDYLKKLRNPNRFLDEIKDNRVLPMLNSLFPNLNFSFDIFNIDFIIKKLEEKLKIYSMKENLPSSESSIKQYITMDKSIAESHL